MGSEILKKKFLPSKKIECFYTQKCIQMTNDGSYMFCQCSNKVNIVSVKTCDVLQNLDCEEEEISCISLSPDNLSLAVGFSSSSIKHYGLNYKDEAVEEPCLISSFKSYHRGPVLTLSWDKSSTLLATGSSDGAARVWDLKQKFCTHSLKEANGVISVLLFDANLHNRPWIFGAANEVIVVWKLESGSSKVLAKLESHTSTITGLTLNHSRDRLISCGLDKVVIVWELESFTPLKTIPVFDSLSGLIMKPIEVDFFGVSSECKDNIVFTIGNKGIPRILDTNTGKEMWKGTTRIIQESEKEILLITNIFLNLSLNSFIITTFDNNILFLNFSKMKIWKLLIGYNDEILDIILAGENLSHTVVASNSPQIRIYQNSNKSCQLVSGHKGTVLALALHPSIRSIFSSCSHDNTARVWSLLDGGAICIAIASGHLHSVGNLSLAQDFMVTGSKDKCIKSWNFDPKTLLKNVEIVSKKIESDDNCLAESHCMENYLNPVSLSAQKTVKVHEKDINSITISKNFKLIASGSLDKTAKILDAATLQTLGVLIGHRKGIWCVRFSSKDRVVATSSADGTIKLWNLNDFNIIASFEGHETSVLKVCYISHCQQLISSASDGVIKLWSVKDNVCVSSFDEHSGKVWALNVVNDGEMFVSGGSDSTLIWWDDVTQSETKKEREEEEKLIEEEQYMNNLVQQKKWGRALKVSLRLGQPYKGLTIMKELLDESPGKLNPVLESLNNTELNSLIEYVVQWNTKTKNVREAQSVLNFLLSEKTPEQLEKLPDWPTLLEGLLPYTDRHWKRIASLHQSASILHFVASQISLQGEKNSLNSLIEDSELLESLNLQPKWETSDSGMEIDYPSQSSKNPLKVSSVLEAKKARESSESSDDLPMIDDIDNENYQVENITASEDENDTSENDSEEENINHGSYSDSEDVENSDSEDSKNSNSEDEDNNPSVIKMNENDIKSKSDSENMI